MLLCSSPLLSSSLLLTGCNAAASTAFASCRTTSPQ
jgi:hypothetical protein